MFRKGLSKKLLLHIAEVSQGSSLDYLTASVMSERADRAMFLVLAHLQAAASAMLWTQMLREDGSLRENYSSAVLLEESLRLEIAQLVERGLSAGAGERFPSAEILRQITESSLKGSLVPRALEVGAQACWEGPFANVYVGPE